MCIRDSSTVGQGSVFTLYFPPADPDAVATAAEPAAPSVVEGGGKRVMYVDDDQALVFLVERALTRKGFVVSSFTDPRRAIAMLRDTAVLCDLLATDFNMPGYSGVELLRDVRLLRPNLPVALASGYVTAEIEASALAEGASALIHKPNDVAELCEIVQGLIQNHEAAPGRP